MSKVNKLKDAKNQALNFLLTIINDTAETIQTRVSAAMYILNLPKEK